MTVQFFPTYRVDYAAPQVGSLEPGELFVEVSHDSAVPPRLWIGTPPAQGMPGDMRLMLSLVPLPDPSIIAIDAIDNPSLDNTVHFTGTVEPGAIVEMALLMGTVPAHLQQVTDWAPWDATSGTFDVTWWVMGPLDNLRVRVRMRELPGTFTDSNLFALAAPVPGDDPGDDPE